MAKKGKEKLKNLINLFRILDYTFSDIGDFLNISATSVYRRIVCETSFTTEEIAKLCEALNIPADRIAKYFLTEEQQARVPYSKKELQSNSKMKKGNNHCGMATVLLEQSTAVTVKDKKNRLVKFKGEVEYCPTNDSYYCQNREIPSAFVVSIEKNISDLAVKRKLMDRNEEYETDIEFYEI